MTGPWNNYGDPPTSPAEALGMPGACCGEARKTVKAPAPQLTPRKGVGELMRLLEGCNPENKGELLTYIGCLEESEEKLLRQINGTEE